MEEYAAENKKAEDKALAQVESTIKEWYVDGPTNAYLHCIRKSKSPVAAVIIEPIASEGGDHHASPDFFRGLREITQRNKVAFIVGRSASPKLYEGLTRLQTRFRPASERRAHSGLMRNGI